MGRALSPARSENDLDISQALFANGNGSDPEERVMVVDVVPETADVIADTFDDDDVDDEAIIAERQAASNRKTTNLKGRTVKKGGAFQALGLNANLLEAITRKGFSVPTPIQRKTIPLLMQEKDVVGMARTGSGKTAAFVIPMIEKLKAHSSRFGARALIFSPARELALQTLQVVKELGRGTDLRSVLLVGGDSLEEQFAAMASNPDVVIATPGRFLHLKVEMNLDLSNMRYVVFDEADRLFEMGFAAQLTETLHALPASRQTLLFSATLPKSLVEFARAGLQEPALVRLDADSKISPDLQNAFFTVKSAEKEGALLHLLQDVIKVPPRSNQLEHVDGTSVATNPSRKRKRGDHDQSESTGAPSLFSTIVFVATKHHVEYLAQLLRLAGFAVSHIYSSLDQIARKAQVHAFRSRLTNVLVATDIGARGIDIPVLANVINYNFPSQPKVFVHRVGRTARAGQKGWSYSLINDMDAPYLLDLQLFLSKPLIVGKADGHDANFTQEVVVGSLRRDNMQTSGEWVNKNLEDNLDLAALRSVAGKGEKHYQRSRNAASSESVKRAKVLAASHSWTELHALFHDESSKMEVEREKMLALVGGFRPQESIFEIGARRGRRKANGEAIEAIRSIRSSLEVRKRRCQAEKPTTAGALILGQDGDLLDDSTKTTESPGNSSVASDSELEVIFSKPRSSQQRAQHSSKRQNSEPFQDSENFMSYLPTTQNMAEDRAYGVHSGSASNFTEAARGATMDLSIDESGKGFGEARGIMRWDKRHKKYVARQNDDDGSKGRRLVRGESGAKIAATFRSGRYDAWRKANKIDRALRPGEEEGRSNIAAMTRGKKYRHQSTRAPKQADKYRDDYDKKKKKVAAAVERAQDKHGRSELRSVDDVRKVRRLKEKRREKNDRPSKSVSRPSKRGLPSHA
jgi:ATP-dependent RNA helicase DDX54/DBP10